MSKRRSENLITHTAMSLPHDGCSVAAVPVCEEDRPSRGSTPADSVDPVTQIARRIAGSAPSLSAEGMAALARLLRQGGN